MVFYIQYVIYDILHTYDMFAHITHTLQCYTTNTNDTNNKQYIYIYI